MLHEAGKTPNVNNIRDVNFWLYIYWSIERPTQFYARAVFITDLAPQFHISFDSPVPSSKSWQPILH